MANVMIIGRVQMGYSGLAGFERSWHTSTWPIKAILPESPIEPSWSCCVNQPLQITLEAGAHRVSRRTVARVVAGLTYLIIACVLAACGNIVDKPAEHANSPQAAACAGYDSSVNPDRNHVYSVPEVEDSSSPIRCNIESMAVAVHNQGEFRKIYGASVEKIDPSTAIQPVIDGLMAAAKRQCLDGGFKCHFKILIFAHGGLVSHKDAVYRAEGLAHGMIADGYAPLFLIWNSDFLTAYWDHLCCVLDGQENDVAAPYFVPARLGSDLGTGAARAMENFGQQIIRFYRSVVSPTGTEYYLQSSDIDKTSSHSICKAVLDGKHCPDIVYPAFTQQALSGNALTIHLNGADQRIDESTPQYFAAAPLRVVSTVGFPAAAAQAWDDMVRRTRLALQDSGRIRIPIRKSDCAAATARATPPNRPGAAMWQDDPQLARFSPAGGGAFNMLFRRLECEIDGHRFLDARGHPVTVELHYYGHSMGALVGNELLMRYPDLPWRRVVYMAAATPIRDFKLMAAPLLNCTEASLLRNCGPTKQDPERPNIHFYSLMLHPLAESHEMEAYGAVPEGSLLEWIDEMFGGPKSVDDRMLGKWTNMERTMAWFPEAERDRMSFRVFPAQSNMYAGDAYEHQVAVTECIAGPGTAEPPKRCHPIEHGEFARYSFWRDMFLCGQATCFEGAHPGPSEAADAESSGRALLANTP
jgi:hypothetical protein